MENNAQYTTSTYRERSMPSINISDSTIRRWAQGYGYQTGSRGPLAKTIILDFAAHQEMSTQQKLHRAEQRIKELEAQGARDQKVIQNLQHEIRSLSMELAEWKDRAAILASVQHSED